MFAMRNLDYTHQMHPNVRAHVNWCFTGPTSPSAIHSSIHSFIHIRLIKSLTCRKPYNDKKEHKT